MRRAIVGFAAASALVGCAIPSGAVPEPGLAPIMAQHLGLSDSSWLGHRATRLELTAEEQARQLQGAGGNRPTFVVLGDSFTNGVIEADVAAVINKMGGKDARGFVGIAFHIDDRRENFEAVYLRIANGTLNEPLPPAPRDVRAVQYTAHPDFHFEDSRKAAPGQYEKPAAVSWGAGTGFGSKSTAAHLLRSSTDNPFCKSMTSDTPRSRVALGSGSATERPHISRMSARSDADRSPSLRGPLRAIYLMGNS